MLLALALAACAPISFEPRGATRAPPVQRVDVGTREVVAGDTLYSIAFDSGHDYRELARWNNIPPPYLIKPGQTLRLSPPDLGSESASIASAPQTHTVRRGDTLYHIGLIYDAEVDDLAGWNGIAPPYRIRPGQRIRLTAPSATDSGKHRSTSAKTKATPRTSSRRSARRATSTDKFASPPRLGGWTWPTGGSLLKRFGSGGGKGINLAGSRGQPIRAANEGEVVYQGGGLRGYGQLIILKHSAEFLSAYAHCDRIYVKEGDVIKRGQKIAAMGSTGTDRPMLHFEIRYRGTPVDPLRYLPKK